MGTWDIGHFDNDTAADFSYELDDAVEGERASILRGALLRTINTPEYLESDLAAEAVAAAAVIAAHCAGGEPLTTPYGPEQPLPQLPADLRDLGVRALDRIVNGPSELVELWGETDESDVWRAGILQLRSTLASHPHQHRSA